MNILFPKYIPYILLNKASQRQNALSALALPHLQPNLSTCQIQITNMSMITLRMNRSFRSATFVTKRPISQIGHQINQCRPGVITMNSLPYSFYSHIRQILFYTLVVHRATPFVSQNVLKKNLVYERQHDVHYTFIRLVIWSDKNLGNL